MARTRLRRSGKPIHPTHWCGMDFFTSNQTTEGTVSVATLCSSDVLMTYTNPTIVRIRGTLWFSLTRNAASSSESIELAAGIVVVPAGLDADDIASLLTLDGSESAWMWFHPSRLQSQLQSYAIWNGSAAINATGSYSGPAAYERIDVDVKAMRRVPAGGEPRLFVSWATDQGDPDLSISGQFRTLIKE